MPKTTPAKPDSSLRIALPPEKNVFLQRQQYAPLGEYLSSELGIFIEFKLLDSYAGIFEKLEKKEVEGAFFGNMVFAITRLQLNILVLARPVGLDGTSTYRSYLVTRKDSGLTEDLATWKGKRFATISKVNAGGYLFPASYLTKAGFGNLENFFSRIIFTGSHDAAAMAAFGGEADLAACKSTVFNKLASTPDPAFREQMVVLAASEELPNNALGLRADLDPALRERLRESLLTMHEGGKGQEVLQTFGAQRFVETTDSDYELVMRMSKEAGVDLHTYPLSEGSTAHP